MRRLEDEITAMGRRILDSLGEALEKEETACLRIQGAKIQLAESRSGFQSAQEPRSGDAPQATGASPSRVAETPSAGVAVDAEVSFMDPAAFCFTGSAEKAAPEEGEVHIRVVHDGEEKLPIPPLPDLEPSSEPLVSDAAPRPAASIVAHRSARSQSPVMRSQAPVMQSRVPPNLWSSTHVALSGCAQHGRVVDWRSLPPRPVTPNPHCMVRSVSADGRMWRRNLGALAGTLRSSVGALPAPAAARPWPSKSGSKGVLTSCPPASTTLA